MICPVCNEKMVCAGEARDTFGGPVVCTYYLCRQCNQLYVYKNDMLTKVNND